MSDADMNTRISLTEWEIKAIKETQQRHEERVAELSTRLDVHHQEVMSAIGSLRDDRARAEGAAEARLADAVKNQQKLRWLSFALATIGTIVALGWFNSSEAAWLPVDIMTDKPIVVQYTTKELP